MKLNKLHRIFILVIAMSMAASLLSACGNMQTNGLEKEATNDGKATAHYLMKKYSLKSDAVTIYLFGVSEGLVITDPADIKLLQDSVDFNSWQYVPPGQGYDGVKVYFVKFNNQTTIAMYLNNAYGLLGQGAPDINGALQNGDAYYFMSESFLQTVQQMVEKYTKE